MRCSIILCNKTNTFSVKISKIRMNTIIILMCNYVLNLDEHNAELMMFEKKIMDVITRRRSFKYYNFHEKK